jgi:hypothetical protein
MKKLFKKHKAVIASATVLLGLFGLTPCINAADTLLSYPQVPGAPQVAFNMSLPDLIKYIYLFAIGICGAVALASILLGAIKYIGAAGNPSKMGDAKEQIVQALFGVVILLSSYLILNTINPDLVDLNINFNSTASVASGRTCSCSYQGQSEIWDCYTTIPECQSDCNAECQWWGYDSGACLADAKTCP